MPCQGNGSVQMVQRFRLYVCGVNNFLLLCVLCEAVVTDNTNPYVWLD